MSQLPASHDGSIQKLLDDGFVIWESNGYLICAVPYIGPDGNVRQGLLADALTYLDPNTVGDPEDHQMYLSGEQPHDLLGLPILLGGGPNGSEIMPGFIANFRFSSKPQDPVTGAWRPYESVYEKFCTYAYTISGPALEKDPTFQLRPMADILAAEDLPLVYRDSLSRRGEIEQLSELLRGQRIAIVGVGGTGSFVLDYLSKTRVAELRLIDDDHHFIHNLYRCPGPTSAAEFRARKVDLLKARYDLIHKGITAHPVKLNETTSHILDGATFAFVCVDKGSSRVKVVDVLKTKGIPFIDVGAGLRNSDEGLAGMARVTRWDEATGEYLDRNRSLPSEDDENNVYARNVQIVELNALNASLAVIMFKKMLGFYRDDVKDFQLAYTLERSALYKQTTFGIV